MKMTVIALTQLLKDAVAGNEAAREALLASFKENVLEPHQIEEIEVYLKAISGKNPQAIYIRGLLTEYGYGVKADSAMAFLLMREAAAKGHSLAIYEVGHRFLEGIGVEKNYQNALQWLEVAAVSPHYIKFAMQDLSRIYEEGLGVEVDQSKAKFWQEKALER